MADNESDDADGQAELDDYTDEASENGDGEVIWPPEEGDEE